MAQPSALQSNTLPIEPRTPPQESRKENFQIDLIFSDPKKKT